MKQTLLISLLSLLVASSLPLLGHEAGHPAAQSPSDKITGPNQGRILTKLKPQAEFFVTADRKARLTFVDDAGKPVAVPQGIDVTLITGDRSAPTTLPFGLEGEGATSTLVTAQALPEGRNFPGILRVKPAANAELVTIRFQINLATCGECGRAEYACVCGH